MIIASILSYMFLNNSKIDIRQKNVNELQQKLDPTARVAFDFTRALLSHSESAYDLSVPETHEKIDIWFESIKTIEFQCDDTRVSSSTGSNEVSGLYTYGSFSISCYTTPDCGSISFQQLELISVLNQNTDYLVKEWDSIRLCDEKEYLENVTIQPLDYIWTYGMGR